MSVDAKRALALIDEALRAEDLVEIYTRLHAIEEYVRGLDDELERQLDINRQLEAADAGNIREMARLGEERKLAQDEVDRQREFIRLVQKLMENSDSVSEWVDAWNEVARIAAKFEESG